MNRNEFESGVKAILVALTVVFAALTVGVVASAVASDTPGVETVFEDGSGKLSDGRSFCIADHLCDD